MTSTLPSLGFVLVFLLFSVLFFYNSYRLWFKTDTYYQDIYNSPTGQPFLTPRGASKVAATPPLPSGEGVFGTSAVLRVDI